MAKAVINLQKESGGIVKISPVDGVGITEVTVPESGELATVDYVKNNGDVNAVTSFSQISGTNEISGIESTNNIHDVFGDGSAVATYTLDGNANDLGGNYNSSAVLSYTTGKFGQGTNSTNNVPLGFNIGTLPSWTVSFWAKASLSSNDNTVMSFSNGGTSVRKQIHFRTKDNGTYGLALYDYGSSIKNKITLGTTTETDANGVIFASGVVRDDNFHHIVSSYQNGTFEYYVDGVIKGRIEGAPAWDLYVGVGNLWINNNNTIDVTLDQVRIFNRALTPSEINTLYTEKRVSGNIQLNINQGTFIYPKGSGARGYIKSSDVFTGTVDVSAQTDGWKYVAKDENNNFSFYTDKPTIGKKSSTLYLENGELYKTIDDTPIAPISFLSNKVRIESGVPVELAPSDISKTVSESLEAGSYFGKNAVVAYASIDMTTTPPTILDSYNIASVIRSSNGVGKITLINPTDKNSVTAICGSNSVAGTITATTKNEVSFATGTTNYAKTSVMVIGGKF